MIISNLNSCNIKFNAIVADPPWRYNDIDCRGAAEHHYSTMSLEDIKNIPIKNVQSENSCLFLWTTNPFLPESFDVMESWGYNYKTTLTWVKSGNIGMGRYFRGTTEHCLFGTTGKVKIKQRNIPTHFIVDKRYHSWKPHNIHKIVNENIQPPYLELFGRMELPNWYIFGNDITRSMDNF